MADSPVDEKGALLTEAAAEIESGDAVDDAVAGDVRSYLRAYYRHVAPEDLLQAGPRRLAAVATEQARFAAHRPQGRALVKVRRGEAAACAPARDVVDIVTDDMPFLVDSVRMELRRHGATTLMVVHPQLRVRRDVTGSLREVLGLIDGERPAHDEIAESWTHIEIARLGRGEDAELQRDLERVLGDVRVAVEDWSRMQAKTVQLADQLAMVPDVRTGRTGWRCAPWRAPGSASCGTTGRDRPRSRRSPRRCGPGPVTRSC
jgi:glutamate dehydrogenase